MIVIRQEEGPYTVPAGRLFVLTALGGLGQASSTLSTRCELSVDGQLEAHGRNQSNAGSLVVEMPPGFTVQAGSVITLEANTNLGRAWGYLIGA